MMGTTRHSITTECILVPPIWRAVVLVLVQIVMVILVITGHDVQSALAGTAGSGLAAAHIVGRLFSTHPTREAR
ncbi:hypothetical protein [Streptomyces sp. 8L]|uniref:hypothetical protein n=1 Tax=Streptomyces sp. 8L TaxID=2877242 RepID=UPI001CD52C21|nr:hypothetical protein [Streptomyces sp. 8L]MCA1224046.1 hypothetical protein [Streptomyces sp. 8L]